MALENRRLCPASPRRFRRRYGWATQPVAGKTILLHAEQGFGDTIQFIRYAPLLAGRGAKVICEVQPELLPLLSQLEGITVIAAGEPLPAFDLHCPLLSLPLAFGTQPETIPAADSLSRRAGGAAWPIGAIVCRRAVRAPDLSGPASRRTRTTPTGRSRSRVLPRCLRTRRSAVSACRASCALRIAKSWRGLPNLVHLGGGLRDFADTAAIISLLDVVVSVDTAVAHLAGALGKPVVILLPHAADFRWMRDRDDTPWYPTAKLLRQPAFGDWDSVIARVGERVAAIEPGGRAGVRISLTTSIYCLVRIAGGVRRFGAIHDRANSPCGGHALLRRAGLQHLCQFDLPVAARGALEIQHRAQGAAARWRCADHARARQSDDAVPRRSHRDAFPVRRRGYRL